MAEQDVTDVDAYIASFPEGRRAVLERLRALIRSAAPLADETISYRMPTYTQGGAPLVFFAGWKEHVALYAVPVFEGGLEASVAPFRAAKDTVRFPVASPLPEELVTAIVTEIVARRTAS